MSVFRDDIIRGQVALVAVGGTGIGKEMARSLAQHGARLVNASASDLAGQVIYVDGGSGVDGMKMKVG